MKALGLILILTISSAWAGGFDYGGRIVDSTGVPVTGAKDMTVKLYRTDASNPTIEVCTKDFTSVTLDGNGVFNVNIDYQAADCGGSTISATLNNIINTLGETALIEITVKDVGDPATDITYPQQAISPSPLAMFAQSAILGSGSIVMENLSADAGCNVGDLLTFDTSGDFKCVANNSGVSTVNVTAPITTTGGTTPTIGLAAGGIMTAHLADGNVTILKMAADSVNSSKIVDGSVGLADIDNNAGGDLTACADGEFLTKQAGGFACVANPNTTLTVSDPNIIPMANGIGGDYMNSPLEVNSGNVGLGVTPVEKFHVHEPSASNTNIAITNSANTNGLHIGVNNLGQGRVMHADSQPLIFGNNNTQLMRLTTSGKVIIASNNTAGSKLRVDGGVTIGNDATACSATLYGTLRWTGTQVEYCDETDAWIAFSSATGTVTSVTAADSTITVTGTTAPTIAVNTIDNSHIAATDSITADRLAPNSVTSSEITDGAVGLADIDNNAGGNLTACADGEFLTKQAGGVACVANPDTTNTYTASTGVTLVGNDIRLVNDFGASIDSSEITDGTIVAADLQTDSVDTTKIVNETIISADIKDGAVELSDLASGSVNSNRILDGSVALIDMANDSVSSTKIVNGTIQAVDVKGNATNLAADCADGEVVRVNTVSGNFYCSAMPSSNPFGASIDGSEITDGTITNTDIATGAVTTSEILDNTIIGADIANGAIDTTQIAADAITSAKIADGSVGITDLDNNAGGNLSTCGNGEYITKESGGFGCSTSVATSTVNATSQYTLNAGGFGSYWKHDATWKIVQFGGYDANSEILQFIVGGTDKMNILKTGEVGIGTTAPTAMLDVNGTVRIRGGIPGVGKVLTSDANGYGSWSTIHTLTGDHSTTSAGSVFGGTNAGSNDDGSNRNVALGRNALNVNTSGSYNTVMGSYAGSNATSSNNVFLGAYAGQDSTQSGNVYIGRNAGMNTTTSQANVFIGYDAGKSATTGLSNTVAIGYNAAVNVTNGGTGVYIGYGAGQNDAGSSNTAVGNVAGAALTGSSNVAVGRWAGFEMNANNVSIGSSSGDNVTGSQNVLIGSMAGAIGTNTAANGNVKIGYMAGQGDTSSNKLYIDNSNTSSPLIKGDFQANSLEFNGSVAIKDGTQSAGRVLTSDGSGNASWQDASGGLQWAGRVNGLANTDFGGVRGASALCNAAFPGSHWATYEEFQTIAESGGVPVTNYLFPNVVKSISYNPGANETYYHLVNGQVMTYSETPQTKTCTGWTGAGSGLFYLGWNTQLFYQYGSCNWDGSFNLPCVK